MDFRVHRLTAQMQAASPNPNAITTSKNIVNWTVFSVSMFNPKMENDAIHEATELKR